MIVDSSALISVLLDEPDGNDMLQAILAAERRQMAAPNWLEASMVFDRKGPRGDGSEFARIIGQLKIEVVPFDGAMGHIAREAWRLYGRGSQHAANLNFGDCMAYALAKHTGEPLLFKGNDFPNTDITPALP